MKFLVIGKFIDVGPVIPPETVSQVIEQAVIPSLKMLAEMEEQGRITGGVFAGERGGCLVVEADSAEEASRILASLPFWGLVSWDVKALQSYSSAVEREQGVVNAMRAAAAQ